MKRRRPRILTRLSLCVMSHSRKMIEELLMPFIQIYLSFFCFCFTPDSITSLRRPHIKVIFHVVSFQFIKFSFLLLYYVSFMSSKVTMKNSFRESFIYILMILGENLRLWVINIFDTFKKALVQCHWAVASFLSDC